MDLSEQILDFGKRARQAARALCKLGSDQKNAALRAMADEVIASGAAILAANEKDLARAQANALSGGMIESPNVERAAAWEVSCRHSPGCRLARSGRPSAAQMDPA